MDKTNWKKNTDKLNLITYEALKMTEHKKISLREMHGNCYVVFKTIYWNSEIETQHFQECKKLLDLSKQSIIAYENPDLNKHERWTNSQIAFEQLVKLSALLQEDVDYIRSLK